MQAEKNMKGNIITAVIWIIIAILLTCMLIFGIKDSVGNSFHLFSSGRNNFAEPYQVKTFPANGIDTISIQLSSSDAVVKRGSDGEVRVELFGSEKHVPTAKLESRTLTISEESTFGFNFDFGKHGVVVYVPQNFDCNKLRISLHSGTISTEDASFKHADFKTSSGTIRVSDGSFDDVSAESSSGTISFDDCSVKNLDCRVSSGTVRVSGYYGELNLKTSSGTIKADLSTALTGDSSMQTSSGTVKVIMPKDADCNIIYSSSSGNYSNTITGTHGKNGIDKMGNGGPELELRASSGMIKVTGSDSVKNKNIAVENPDEKNFLANKNSPSQVVIPTAEDVRQINQEDLARAEAYFQNTTVYYTRGGKVYHSHEDCGYLKNSKDVIEGKVAQAFKSGKSYLCKTCAKKDGVTNKDLPVQQ